MGWLALILAGIFEIIWAVALKYSEGFTKLYPSIIFILTALISLTLLSYALKTIPMGSAYAIWTGIGAVGIAIFGMTYFGEPAGLLRIICIAFIVLGIIGLKLVGSGESVLS